VSYPKIELHVHLERTVRAGTLLQIARRNGVPLPADSAAVFAGCVRCAVSADDPAMFGTDLTAEYAAARQLGVSPQACYQAGVDGALCAEAARAALATTGHESGWAAA
jgi:adenosine deaminase